MLLNWITRVSPLMLELARRLHWPSGKQDAVNGSLFGYRSAADGWSFAERSLNGSSMLREQTYAEAKKRTSPDKRGMLPDRYGGVQKLPLSLWSTAHVTAASCY